MNKLRTSALGLLLLFIFLVTHGTLPAEKIHSFDAKAKAIIQVDQSSDELPQPDTDDKKTFTILYTLFVLLVSRSYISRPIPENTTAIFAFLTAVFFQSNYVIKPLRF